MTRDELRGAVIRQLRRLAPETDPASLAGDADWRDALDIDSLDFLNFIAALRGDLGVDVPEADYPRLATLRSCVDYLAGRLGLP